MTPATRHGDNAGWTLLWRSTRIGASCYGQRPYQSVEKGDWLRAQPPWRRRGNGPARCLYTFSTGCYPAPRRPVTGLAEPLRHIRQRPPGRFGPRGRHDGGRDLGLGSAGVSAANLRPAAGSALSRLAAPENAKLRRREDEIRWLSPFIPAPSTLTRIRVACPRLSWVVVGMLGTLTQITTTLIVSMLNTRYRRMTTHVWFILHAEGIMSSRHQQRMKLGS